MGVCAFGGSRITPASLSRETRFVQNSCIVATSTPIVGSQRDTVGYKAESVPVGLNAVTSGARARHGEPHWRDPASFGGFRLRDDPLARAGMLQICGIHASELACAPQRRADEPVRPQLIQCLCITPSATRRSDRGLPRVAPDSCRRSGPRPRQCRSPRTIAPRDTEVGQPRHQPTTAPRPDRARARPVLPIRLSVTASVRNWSRTSSERALVAMRNPIS